MSPPVATEVVFEGQAPNLSQIADKVSELSGLPLLVMELDATTRGVLYDMHGDLAFACAPKLRLNVYTYHEGAAKEYHGQTEGEFDLPPAKYAQGLGQTPEIQTVHLERSFAQEPTLMNLTILALDVLGGQPREPLGDEERRRYLVPISPTHLQERERKLLRQMWLEKVLFLALLPILIPIWLLSLFAMMPWFIWKMYRFYQTYQALLELRDRKTDKTTGRTRDEHAGG